MNGICSFYRELDVGLLVWIHHHHGWCWWLMEYVKWSARNSFHVLKATCRVCLCGTFGGLFVEFTKYNLVVHGSSRLWIKPSIENFLQTRLFCYTRMGIVHAYSHSWMVFFGRGQVMDDNEGWVILSWSPSVAPSSLCCLPLLLWPSFFFFFSFFLFFLT